MIQRILIQATAPTLQAWAAALAAAHYEVGVWGPNEPAFDVVGRFSPHAVIFASEPDKAFRKAFDGCYRVDGRRPVAGFDHLRWRVPDGPLSDSLRLSSDVLALGFDAGAHWHVALEMVRRLHGLNVKVFGPIPLEVPEYLGMPTPELLAEAIASTRIVLDISPSLAESTYLAPGMGRASVSTVQPPLAGLGDYVDCVGSAPDAVAMAIERRLAKPLAAGARDYVARTHSYAKRLAALFRESGIPEVADRLEATLG